MNTASKTHHTVKGKPSVPGKRESPQLISEIILKRYIGTFELIEDPNNPGTYYDGPY